MRYLDLIVKYDTTGPRYTSYPPLPYWDTPPTEELWLEHVSEAKTVDLYIHVPFCKTICHYCGCNRVQMCSSGQIDQYIDYVLKEWAFYKSRLGLLKINAIHLGGGTPNILSDKQMDQLLSVITNQVNSDDFHGSIEIDPRSVNKLQLKMMYRYGLNRLSFGVQDFDHKVQTLIGREQSYETVREIYDISREIGFREINFDMIYGLPGQTTENVKETFSKVVNLRPETIAYYSFAYVPHFAKNQNVISSSDIVQGLDKWQLLDTGRNILFKAYYQEVGMDHYALNESSLYKAFLSGSIQRNFMGYVNHKSDAIIGLGLTAISSTHKSFIQNSKDFGDYYKMIDQGMIPFAKGHVKNKDDMFTESLIHQIMCKQKIKLNMIDVDKIRPFIEDKLMRIEGDEAVILPQGKSFLRNICMQFDKRLTDSKKSSSFSRTI